LYTSVRLSDTLPRKKRQKEAFVAMRHTA
jgi:hypothetical protein